MPTVDLNFQAINAWDAESRLQRYLDKDTSIVKTDTGVVVVVEKTGLSMLDVLAKLISKSKKQFFTLSGRKMYIEKRDAEAMSKILKDQANKLEGMAATYRLLASILDVNSENFEEIFLQTRKDDNPF